MKSYKQKTGVTLVEILIVVAVIAILVSMVIGIAARIDNQGKEQLTKNTLAILDTALGQFQDYGYDCNVSLAMTANNERDFYRSLNFPIDCNTSFSYTAIRRELEKVLGVSWRTITITDTGGIPDANYFGSEVLYFFLSRVPDCRQTLDEIDGKLITNLDKNGNPWKLTVGPRTLDVYPLMRFIDPWGTTLRYDYYDAKPPNHSLIDIQNMEKSKKTFPVITSAGPDKIFGTADDIKSR
ncbi:MAG: type II secretion system protein [Sedimentisphaerales bacterium]